MQGRILFQPLQAYCPLWGAKPARFWFSSDVGGQDFHPLGLTPQSHIGKKCAPRMPYKLLGKGMVYHYYMPYKLLGKGMVYHYYTCGSGTPCHCPRAYKAYVGRISCRCGTKVSSPKGENPDLPRRLKTKTLRAWLPKETISLQGLEQNPPLQLESNSTTMLELYR